MWGIHLAWFIYISDVDHTDLYWLAGILEGEGSFLKGPPSRPGLPIISMQSTDEDVVSHVANLLGGVKYHACARQKEHHKVSWRVSLKGSKSVVLMQQLQPLMSVRRQKQIADALSSFNGNPPHAQKALDSSIVARIRERLIAGDSVLELAKEFNVKRSTIYNVKNFKHAYASIV